jgi:PleD family two-component response regulator
MTAYVASAWILVVDDQQSHLRALCDILGQHGFDVTGCATGEAALGQASARPFRRAADGSGHAGH